MDQINDINSIINNLPMIINNYLDDHDDDLQWNIGWVIDRTPDLNLINNINTEFDDINFINNIQNIRNQHFDEIFAEATQSLLNGTIQFNSNADADTHDNIDDLPELINIYDDDFIPFEPLPIHQPTIQTEVHEILVSDEERVCPICYETRECQDISQINCGHKFCGLCLTKHIHKNRIQSRCPLCRENITHITFQTHQDNAVFLEI